MEVGTRDSLGSGRRSRTRAVAPGGSDMVAGHSASQTAHNHSSIISAPRIVRWSRRPPRAPHHAQSGGVEWVSNTTADSTVRVRDVARSIVCSPFPGRRRYVVMEETRERSGKPATARTSWACDSTAQEGPRRLRGDSHSGRLFQSMVQTLTVMRSPLSMNGVIAAAMATAVLVVPKRCSSYPARTPFRTAST